MKEIIKEVLECQQKLWALERQLDNKDYWINKAKEEAGFVPRVNSWIHVKVETWRVEVSVHNGQDSEQTKVWINGKWFDTYFPKDYPSNIDYLKELSSVKAEV